MLLGYGAGELGGLSEGGGVEAGVVLYMKWNNFEKGKSYS